MVKAYTNFLNPYNTANLQDGIFRDHVLPSGDDINHDHKNYNNFSTVSKSCNSNRANKEVT